jgi:hypothetical protein
MKKTFQTLLVIAFIFCTTAVQAKKVNYPFEALVGLADMIVTGYISHVSGDSSYIFVIDQTVKGEMKKEVIVKVFTNWTCDIRWKKPEVGQKLFLFLLKKNDRYETIGGSDGEIFIVENKLRLFNIFNPMITKGFTETDSPKLDDVIVSIKNLMSCYSFSRRNNYSFIFSPIKNENEILIFKKANSFSIWLFDKVKEHNSRVQERTTANVVIQKHSDKYY